MDFEKLPQKNNNAKHINYFRKKYALDARLKAQEKEDKLQSSIKPM